MVKNTSLLAFLPSPQPFLNAFRNAFFKVVVLVLGKLLGKSILDSSLLACLLVMGVLLVYSIDPKFSIISQPIYWQLWNIGKER